MISKTRVVLSFDDGRGDNYYVAMNELLPRKLPATFNITTGYIMGENLENEFDGNVALTISQLKELAEIPIFEIAGHGYAHLNTVEDWKKGFDGLFELLGKERFDNGIGVASPHSIINLEKAEQMLDELSEYNLTYIRTGLLNYKSLWQRIISRIAMKSGSNILFYLPIESCIKNVKQPLVYSIPVLHEHLCEQIKYTICKASKDKKDVVLMFHSVLKKNDPFYESMWSWDYKRFVDLCDFLCVMRDKGKIDVSRNIDIF